MGAEYYLSLALSLLGAALVIVFTYYGSRWLAKRYGASSGGRMIRIIDRAALGKDKSIVIAEICGEKYILGVGAQQISLLKELGEVELNTPEQGQEFLSIFSGMLKNKLGGQKGGKED